MQGKVSRTWAAAFAFTLSALFVAQSLASDVIPPSDVVAPAETSSASPSPSEIPTPTPSPTPTVTPIKKTTITCVKGKVVKKVTGVKPLCPKGYTKK